MIAPAPFYTRQLWAGAKPGSSEVEAALDRLHNLLGAVDAFGVRVADLANEILRSSVPLGS